MPFDNNGKWVPPGGKWATSKKEEPAYIPEPMPDTFSSNEMARQYPITEPASAPDDSEAGLMSRILGGIKDIGGSALNAVGDTLAAAGKNTFDSLSKSISNLDLGMPDALGDIASKAGKSVLDAIPDPVKNFAKDVADYGNVSFDEAFQRQMNNPAFPQFFKDRINESPLAQGFTQPNLQDRSLGQDFGAGLRRWSDGQYQTVANAAKWVGQEGLGNSVEKFAPGSEGFEPEYKFEGWHSLYDPHWLAGTMLGEGVPSMLSLMPLALGGGAAGGAAAGALGLGRVGTTIMKALGGTLASRPIESVMEAASTYEQMQGTHEDKQKAANDTFLKNMAVGTPLDMLELGAVFMPKGIGGIVSKLKLDTLPARIAASSVLEAGEEGLQSWIQNSSQGKETSLSDPAMQESMALGGLLGGFSAGGMSIATQLQKARNNVESIHTRAIDKMDDETRTDYIDSMKDAKEQGIPEAEAREHLLETWAATPEGEKAIAEATQEIVESVRTEQEVLGAQPAAEVAAAPIEEAPAAEIAPIQETPAAEIAPMDIQAAAPVEEISPVQEITPTEQTIPAAEIQQPAPVEEIQQPAPEVKAEKPLPTLGDIVKLRPTFGRTAEQQFVVVGDLGKGTFRLRNEETGKEMTINKAGITEITGKKEISAEESTKAQAKAEFDGMRNTLTADSGKWKSSTKLKHLQKMQELADQHGIEMPERLKTDIKTLLEADAAENKNRQRKATDESWQDASGRLNDKELRWELEGLKMDDLRSLRDELGIPKSKAHKVGLIKDIVDNLKGNTSEAKSTLTEMDLSNLSDKDLKESIMRGFFAGDNRELSETDKKNLDALQAEKDRRDTGKESEKRKDSGFSEEQWAAFDKMKQEGEIKKNKFEPINLHKNPETGEEVILGVNGKDRPIADLEHYMTPKAEPAPNVLNDHHAKMKERAEAARKRIKTKYGSGGTNLNSGLPLDLMADLTIIGYTKILDGIADFKTWSDEMVKESPNGEKVRKWLPAVFAQANHINSLPPEEVDSFIDEMLMDAYGENPDAEPVVEQQQEEVKQKVEPEIGKWYRTPNGLIGQYEKYSGVHPAHGRMGSFRGVAADVTFGAKLDEIEEVETPADVKRKKELPRKAKAWINESGSKRNFQTTHSDGHMDVEAKEINGQLFFRFASGGGGFVDESPRVQALIEKGKPKPKKAKEEPQHNFDKLFFALSPNQDEIASVAKAQPKSVLLSYARWNKKNIKKDFLDAIGYHPDNVIVDSGAFTFKGKKNVGLDDIMEMYAEEADDFEPGVVANHIRQDLYQTDRHPDSKLDGKKDKETELTVFHDYIEFLDANSRNIDYVMTLDDMKDPDASLFSFQVMQELGYNLLPVFHYGNDMKYLDSYVEAGADYIALGGSAVGVKENVRAAWANEVIQKYPQIKFHLLGTNNQRLIDKIPGLYSADGSRWQAASMRESGAQGREERSEAGAAEIRKREDAVEKRKLKPKQSTAITERGTEIKTRFAIVDASELIASHTTDFKPNESYPQDIQPRDRERAGLQDQVRRLSGTLKPNLLGESPKAGDGAPIVSPEYEVESGNGRTMAMQLMYENHTAAESKYREWLQDHAAEFGFDASSIPANPVLVRVRETEMTMDERVRFAHEANESSVSRMSATEKAEADAAKVSSEMMDLFSPGDEGNILAASNREFVQRFIAGVVGPNEQTEVMDKDGALNQEGVNRIKNAIFAKAYGNTSAIERLVESTDNNVKTLTNAMLSVAPRMAMMKTAMESGERYQELDITGDIIAAVQKLSELKNDGQTVEFFMSQGDMFGTDLADETKNLLVIFDSNRRSAKKISTFLNAYMDIVDVAGDPNQLSMFGDNVVPTKIEAQQAALQKLEVTEDENQITLWSNTAESSRPASAVVAEEGLRTEEKRVQPDPETGKIIVSLRQLTDRELSDAYDDSINEMDTFSHRFLMFAKAAEITPYTTNYDGKMIELPQYYNYTDLWKVMIREIRRRMDAKEWKPEPRPIPDHISSLTDEELKKRHEEVMKSKTVSKEGNSISQEYHRRYDAAQAAWNAQEKAKREAFQATLPQGPASSMTQTKSGRNGVSIVFNGRISEQAERSLKQVGIERLTKDNWTTFEGNKDYGIDAALAKVKKEIDTNKRKEEGEAKKAALAEKKAAAAAEKEAKAAAKAAPAPAPASDVIDQFKANRSKLKKLEYNLADIHAQYELLVNHEAEVKAHFMDLINNSDQHKRKRANTKAELVEKLYNDALNQLGYADSNMMSITYDVFSMGKEKESQASKIKKVIDKITDESIQKHIASELAKVEQHKKSMENPETFEELQRKKTYGALNEDEQSRYDEFVAERLKDRKTEDAKKKVESKAAVEGIRGGSVSFDIREGKHTKTGDTIWIATMTERVDNDTFKEIRSKIKALGGYYSNFRPNVGFIFSQDPSEQLAALAGGETVTLDKEGVFEEQQADKHKTNAAKLRGVAEGMQDRINDLRRDRKTHTHRMASQAASAASEADSLERIQKVMLNIATAIESGEAKHLDGITARTHIETLDSIIRRRVTDLMHANKEPMLDRNGNHIRRDPKIEDINGMEFPKAHLDMDRLKKFVDMLIKNKVQGTVRIAAKIDKLIHSTKKNDDRAYLVDVTPYLEEIQEMFKNAEAHTHKTSEIADEARSFKERLMTVKRLHTMGIEKPEQLRAALREYLTYREGTGVSAEEKKRREMKQREGEATRSKIEGFFPTPTPIVERMIEEAGIEKGMKVLEPSAGKGNIAEMIRDEHPDANLEVVEYNNTLRTILEDKGFNVVSEDFTKHAGSYDRIIMNPPFENGQDIEHVRHAYDLLEPGGRVVAIMSEGPFYRSDKQAAAFRDWLEQNGGMSEPLEEGAFKSSERPTGVRTRIVTIDKGSAAATETAPAEKVQAKTPESLTVDQVNDEIVNLLDERNDFIKQRTEAGNTNQRQKYDDLSGTIESVTDEIAALRELLIERGEAKYPEALPLYKQYRDVIKQIDKLEGRSRDPYLDQVSKMFHLGTVGGAQHGNREMKRLNKRREHHLEKSIELSKKLNPLYEQRSRLEVKLNNIERGKTAAENAAKAKIREDVMNAQVGDTVLDSSYGEAKVIRVNQKTLTIETPSGFKEARSRDLILRVVKKAAAPVENKGQRYTVVSVGVQNGVSWTKVWDSQENKSLEKSYANESEAREAAAKLNKSAEQIIQDRLRGQQRSDNMGIVPSALRNDRPRNAPRMNKFESSDPLVEMQLKSAFLRPPGPWDNFKEWLGNVKRQITREFQHLPHTKDYAKVRFELHRMQKAPAIAQDVVLREYLTGITRNLNRDDYQLMMRIVVLRDLKRDYERDVALKFGYTIDVLETDLSYLEDIAADNPKVMDAIELRNQLFKEKSAELVAAYAKIDIDVSDKFHLENYLRHLVLEYVNGDRQISAAKKVVKARTNSGYMSKRNKGGGNEARVNELKAELQDIKTEMDNASGKELERLTKEANQILQELARLQNNFVVDILTADAEVLTSMITDMQTAEVLGVIMHDPALNKKKALKAQAKQMNQDALDQLFQDEIDSEKYVKEQVSIDGEEFFSPLEMEHQEFAKRIAIGMSNLSKLAAKDELWTGENGEYASIVDQLKKRVQQDTIDDENSNSTDQLFKYLSALLASGETGASPAGMIFKAVQERKAWVRAHIDFKTWENIIPEGYSKFEPAMGSKFYPVQEIDVNKLAKDLAAGILTEVASTDDLQPYLETAFKKAEAANTMVIPDELAATLIDLSDTHERSSAYRAIKAVNNFMKKNLLFAGPRFIQYEIRNFSSDVEKMFANKIAAFKYLPSSTAQLYNFVAKDHAAPNDDVRDFAMMGGMQTLYGVAELGDLHKLEEFTRFYDKPSVPETIKRATYDRYWRITRRVDTLRETAVRFSLYRAYLDELNKNGGKVKDYGSSVPDEVDALDTNQKKAFLMANDALIDYSKTSHLGRRARDTVVPFWSFTEGNTRSTYQWMKNVIHDNRVASAVGRKLLGKAVAKTPYYAIKIGKAYVAMTMLTILLYAWNHGLHDDEEEELPEDIRNQLHIIWGRDTNGNIAYTSGLGAAEDFFKWVGLDDVYSQAMDMASGRRTFGEVVVDILKQPVNKIVGLVNPIVKNTFEGITGTSTYPDVFTPGTSSDGFDDKMVQLLGLGNEYKAVKKEMAGVPAKSYDPLAWMTTLKNPGENAYYEVKDLVRDYKKRIGSPAFSGGGERSGKSEALFQYKQALKFGDEEAADRYLMKYVELGGTAEGIRSSLEALDPLSALSTSEMGGFLESLTPADEKRLDRAMNFFTDTLLGGTPMK